MSTNPAVPWSIAVVLVTSFTTSAVAECFFVPTMETFLLQQRYLPSSVLIDVVGPDPESCRDKGTGVIVSDTGTIMTARHVVVKDECPNTGVFVSFAWAPDQQLEATVLDGGPHDVAFLAPAAGLDWGAGDFCTARVADSEPVANEPLIRFGRVDPGKTATPAIGSVILGSADAGRPPMQLVCSIIYPGDSGGPVYSARSGELVGITVQRIEKDENQNPVYNRGLTLPITAIRERHADKFVPERVCSDGDILLTAGGADWQIAVPYQFSVSPDFNVGAFLPIERRLFKPLFGFHFDGVEGVTALMDDGSTFSPDICSEKEVPNASAVCVSILENGDFLAVAIPSRTAHKPDTADIVAVTVHTKQTFGDSGIDWIRTAKIGDEIIARAVAGTASSTEKQLVLQALASAPAELTREGTAVLVGGGPDFRVSAEPNFQYWLSGSNAEALKLTVEQFDGGGEVGAIGR